jgi:solute carrier family 50 protein (sugar transporter)
VLIRLLYGYGSDNVFPLMAISVFGLIMSSLYVVCYIRWSKERAYIAKAISVTMLLIIPATVYVVLFAVGTIHQSKDDFKLVLGYATNIQNMFAFLAPLEKVKQVLITKSAAPIPVLMSAAIFVNCVLWMSSGVVKHDNFLIVPNVIGATLGAIQVVLYFIYRPTRYTIEAVDKLELPVDLEMYSTCDQISPHAASFRPLVSPMEPIRS